MIKKETDLFNPAGIPKLIGLVLITIVIICGIFFIANLPFLFSIPHFFPIITIILILITLSVYIIATYSNPDNKQLQTYLEIALLLFVSLNFISQFYPLLDNNGDNAEYIIRAMALAESKGSRVLYLLGQPIDPTLYNIGFCSLLVPLLKLTPEFNAVVLKMLPLLSAIGGLVLIVYTLKNWIPRSFAVIIAVIIGTQRQYIHFSSIIMSEVPFIFFMTLSIFLTVIYMKKEKLFHWTLFGSAAAVFMTFLIRFAGIGLLAAPFFVLLAKGPKKYWKKAVAVTLILIILFGGFLGLQQISKSNYQKEADAGKYIKMPVTARFTGGLVSRIFYTVFHGAPVFHNLQVFSLSMSQKLSAYPDRPIGQINRAQHSPPTSEERREYGILWWNWVLLIFICAGLVIDCIKNKGTMTIFFLFLFPPLLLSFTGGTDYYRGSRYAIPFIPFVLYYIYVTAEYINELLLKLKIVNLSENNKKALGYIIPYILLLFLFMPNVKAAPAEWFSRPEIRNTYPPRFQSSFIDCSRWIKNNNENNVTCVSRKERLFYLFSEIAGGHYAYLIADSWKDKPDSHTIMFYTRSYYTAQYLYDNKFDYLAADSFSGNYTWSDCYNKVYKLIALMPECFDIVFTPAQPVDFGPLTGETISENQFASTIEWLDYVRVRQADGNGELPTEIFIPSAVFKINHDRLPALMEKIKPYVYQSSDMHRV